MAFFSNKKLVFKSEAFALSNKKKVVTWLSPNKYEINEIDQDIEIIKPFEDQIKEGLGFDSVTDNQKKAVFGINNIGGKSYNEQLRLLNEMKENIDLKNQEVNNYLKQQELQQQKQQELSKQQESKKEVDNA